MKLNFLPLALLCFLSLLASTATPADAAVISYWAFDDSSDFSRSSGTQGTLAVQPDGWFTKVSFPTGGTTINRINIGQTNYEYMRIDDPVSILTVGLIKIDGLDLTGLSGLELSFAAYVSDFISVEFDREAVCFVDGSEVSREPFDIAQDSWTLTTIDLPAGIDNESDVRIELQFNDLLNIDYRLHVDNIQLTAVPEPASLCLLTLGATALLRRRSRKA